MTLVTTAGASNADSYVALADTDAYFAARGVTTWTGSDTVKEQALRRATTYLDNQYRDRWIGLAATQEQALAWPRVDGSRDPWHRSLQYPLVDINGFEIADNVVPQQIKTATMEAALLIVIGTTLEPVLTRGGAVKQETIGPISVTYTDGASPVDRYLVIEGLLRGLVTSSPGSSSGNTKLVRA